MAQKEEFVLTAEETCFRLQRVIDELMTERSKLVAGRDDSRRITLGYYLRGLINAKEYVKGLQA